MKKPTKQKKASTLQKKTISLTTAQKVDNVQKFDAIETGITDINNKNIVKDQEDKINRWRKVALDKPAYKIKPTANPSDISWVGKHHKQIHNMIKDIYTNPSSYNAHINALYNILLAIDKVKYKTYARNLILEHKEKGRVVLAKTKEQTLSQSEKDNFVCFDDMRRARDEWYEIWMKDPKDNMANMIHLILSLYTYLPPVRMNYIDMQFIVEHPSKYPNDANYCYQDKKGNYFFMFNIDKVSDTTEAELFDLPNNKYTDGDMMTHILDRSYEEFPRDWLLAGVKGANTENSMSASTFETYMRTKVFDGKRVSVNIFRKAFVNHYYDQKFKFSYEVREEIAKRMRHGLDITEMQYGKPELKEMCKDVETYKETKKEHNVKIEALEEEPKPVPKLEPIKAESKAKFNVKVWGKEYRAKIGADVIKERNKLQYEKNKFIIQQKKMINNLNSGNTKDPRKAVEYGIVKDANGVWVAI